MGNYKFYTPPMLAECLIQLIPQRKYDNIIDICCGSWNLLEAARKQFSVGHYVGVDIDEEAKAHCFKNATFLREDGRTFALQEKKKYDLVLSNPPFGYLKEEERIFKNLNGTKGIVKGLNNKRYENEMIQANLLLAEEAGVLLFILPSTFFEGATYLSVRKELCKQYTIDSIIKLPIETFGNSKINTYAVIMINSGKQTMNATLKEVVCENKKLIVKNLEDISVESLKEGMWVRQNKNINRVKDVVLFRGNISSSLLGEKGKKVFHSSGILKNGKWEPSIRYCSDECSIRKAKVVFPGDIIVNRVGRYANYWCVSKEEGYVSDCLIVIRMSRESDVYEKLLQHSTDGRLDIITKGVTTKYVTMSDILELL